jgi:alpha-galactosidase
MAFHRFGIFLAALLACFLGDAILSSVLGDSESLTNGDSSQIPEIHYPRIVGFGPNHPFLFKIPATGSAPLVFSADGLPKGLTLNPETGVISGKTEASGETDVTIVAKNPLGKATAKLALICGPGKLAQTPPMMWEADNVFGVGVTAADIRSAADQLVATGLAGHGYQYLLIGDSWEGKRDAEGALRPNYRFSDMKALAAYVHSKGLKLGLYSSATSQTPSGFAGSLGYEAKDAATFASWGIDYLTYDWTPTETEGTLDPQKPFAAMGTAIIGADRDVIYALRVPRRMSEPDSVGDEIFEARSGIYDKDSVIHQDALLQEAVAADFGPGHWIGHGILFVGRYGYPDLHLSHLTAQEQMMQMTLWSLFSAPLTLSCDLNHLDPNKFNRATTSILTNDEVIAVDQDPGAKPPVVVSNRYGRSVWMKPLADGRVAVAFVNVTDGPDMFSVSWADLNITGAQPVRDLWSHTDLPSATDQFSLLVQPHAAAMVIIGKSAGS